MIWVILIVFFSFTFVILFGAPYLPTLKKERKIALELLNLKPGQTLLELGCGDGRLLNDAAKYGIKSIGYELNPILVITAKALTFSNRRLVQIKWANYWRVKWPPCDGIYVFLLDKYMYKIDKSMRKQNIKNTKLLSYGFEIQGKKYLKKHGGFFLYQY